MKKIITLLIFAMISNLAFADELRLKNGSVIEGNISSITPKVICIYVVIDGQPANCLMSISKSEIAQCIDNNEYSGITYQEPVFGKRVQNNIIEEKRQKEIATWAKAKDIHEKQMQLEQMKLNTVLEKEILLAHEQRQNVDIGIEVNNNINASSSVANNSKNKKKELCHD